MDTGVQRFLFPGTLGVSLVLHGIVAVIACLWVIEEEPPQLLTPEPGVSSILVRVSEAARPKPTEQVLQKLLTDLPPLPELSQPHHLMPDPLPVKVEEINRPRTTDPLILTKAVPELRPENTIHQPAELPPLDLPLPKTPDVKPIVPLLKNTKDGPLALPRPTTKDVLPKLEALTIIADLAAVTSQASDASQGATVDELPRKLAVNPPPPYPPDAQRAGLGGKVVLRVGIDAAGKVTTISIHSGSGFKSFDESALSTVRNWVFAPARRAGQPVPFEVLVPIEFYIRGRY